jgi:hypothetical protein
MAFTEPLKVSGENNFIIYAQFGGKFLVIVMVKKVVYIATTVF